MTVLLLVLVLAAALVGCDHATKELAEAGLRNQPAVVLVPGVLDLSYAANHDVGFGLLRFIPVELRRGLIIGVVSLLSLGLLVLLIRGRATSRWEHTAYALMLAGALGNLQDRIFRGYVVDFLHLHHWPMFNVADICVFCGAALLFFSAWRIRPPPSQLRTGCGPL